jgi:hypothetical protein
VAEPASLEEDGRRKVSIVTPFSFEIHIYLSLSLVAF